MTARFAYRSSNHSAPERPLCVDAEGMLVRGNPLWESWFALLRLRPTTAILALIKLFRGGSEAFASHLSRLVDFQAAQLPYDEAVLEQLRRAKATGRTVALVTTLPQAWTVQIVSHLGLFDAVLPGRPHTLGGQGMSSALTAGHGAGSPPLPREHSSVAFATAASAADRSGRCREPPDDVILRKRATWRTWTRQLRLHQWLKNLLVYVPLVAARKVGDPGMVAEATAAFVAFGCIASATYILNDLLDLPHDRRHPTKRHRPLAAGLLSIPSVAVVMAGLFVGGGLVASTLPVGFAGVLALYLCGTVAYSLFLKRTAPLDVFTLAGLYALRVLAGNAATGLPISFWLLAFSIFLFLSLAMAKRHAELLRLGVNGESTSHGRGYGAGDLEMVRQLGVAAGYVSALVLALYLNSPQAALLYSRPDILWLLCGLLLYWITHLWLTAHRGRLDDDPVVFALRDRVSRVVALIAAAILILAR